MDKPQDQYAWPIRLKVGTNEIDYILQLTRKERRLDIDIPLFKLPASVQKLSLKKMQVDTVAKIKARGRLLLLETYLVLTNSPPELNEKVVQVGRKIKPIWQEMILDNIGPPTPNIDPLQAYLQEVLCLDSAQGSPAAHLLLALSRLATPDETIPLHAGKSVSVLLRDSVTMTIKIVETLLPLWSDVNKRELLSRFRIKKDPFCRQFLLQQLSQPANEKFAEGIVIGLEPYNDLKVLNALNDYSQGNHNHSPRTLARFARWLTSFPGPAAHEPLEYLLKSLNLQVAKAAGKAMRQRGMPRDQILTKLARSLYSEDLQTRAAAWGVLEDFDWSSESDQQDLWKRMVDNLIQQPEAGVKGMAPAILKHIHSTQLITRIENALEGNVAVIQAGMLFLLERLNNRNTKLITESTILRLIPLLESDSFEVRRIVGHLLSGLLRRPLGDQITTELLTIYERSADKRARRLTIIGCWVVLFQHNPFDSRVEQPLLETIATAPRSIMLAAWRLVRSSDNPEVHQQLSALRAAGKLKKQ